MNKRTFHMKRRLTRRRPVPQWWLDYVERRRLDRLPFDFGALSPSRKRLFNAAIWSDGRDMAFWMQGFEQAPPAGAA